MPKIAIIVEFEAKPGMMDQLEPVMREHARLTLAQEPGCLRFEVLRPVGRDGTPVADKLMVNELYADFDAVTAHEGSARLPKLRETTGPLLANRKLVYATVD